MRVAMSVEGLFSRRTSQMGASAIREILKVVDQPGMISLAGGIPAAESFPLEALKSLTAEVISRYGAGAYQYGVTEGFGPLREAVARYLSRKEIRAAAGDVIVTTGSQGALDALGKVLITPGDRIAVEAPTYLGALSAFNPYEPSYVQIPTDDDGAIPEELDACLASGPVKFIYLVPTFQNPTGRSLSLERRRRIAEVIVRRNALLIEDDPYGDLRYRGSSLPAIKSMAPDNVVYLGTFSKVFAPGLRVGFAAGPESVLRWMVVAKQGTDLHTSTFNQALCAAYLESGAFERHLPEIVDLYSPRLDAMIAAMREWFPPWVTWSHPEGGMFVWVEAGRKLDLVSMYERAIAENVAYVPGAFFYATPGDGLSTMRLNFSMNDEEAIASAVRTLGRVLAAEAAAPSE
ncbi:MAG: PLP-dependent aminotransferase family protein [Spirochaetales bacterium]